MTYFNDIIRINPKKRFGKPCVGIPVLLFMMYWDGCQQG